MLITGGNQKLRNLAPVWHTTCNGYMARYKIMLKEWYLISGDISSLLDDITTVEICLLILMVFSVVKGDQIDEPDIFY